MLKVRLNLRNMAAIAACLAVNVLFLSCDEDNGDNNNGKVDKKLIANWEYVDSFQGVIYVTEYLFKNDGSFRYMQYQHGGTGPLENPVMDVVEGKFTTSASKLYLTGVHQYRQSVSSVGEKTYWSDKVVDYAFATDNFGEYLSIKHLGRFESTCDSNTTMYKYRKK